MQIEWIYAGESDPATEYRRAGVTVSVQVLCYDEDGEMYIARLHGHNNGTCYWKEETLVGINTVIPNVVAWAYKPQTLFEH